ALTLSPDERRTKAILARQAVERSDLNTWLTRQIHDLNELLERSAALPVSSSQATSASSGVVAHVS
ncbi:MAG TPA: hypothetical protein VGN34_11850, partial [Ktedonobacteraceae bacterium]